MSRRTDRLLIWLGATLGGAGLIYAALANSAEILPAVLGVMWVLGAVALAAGVMGIAGEAVAFVNRALPDQTPSVPSEPMGSPRIAEPHPTGKAPAPYLPAAPLKPITLPPRPTPPPYEQLADGRVVYNVTLDQLMGLFKDQTTAQGNRQALPWIGKLMRFSGSVFNVNEHDTWAMVAMKPVPKGEGLVFASFNTPDLMSRVAVLKRDDRIGVIGRIHQIEWNSVSLEDCELVEL